MKKLYFLILLFPFVFYAKSFLISNIALPKTSIQNLDPYPCDEKCLQEHLDNGYIFSFLAHADEKLANEELEKERARYLSALNIKWFMQESKIRIALLLPYKKIGRYAASTTNASFAYLMSKNHPYELKSYNIEDESHEEILTALIKIREDGFYHVIAPLTQTGEEIVSTINPDINIYFPTINKKDTNTTSNYLYYGGIDHRAQSDLLLKEALSPLIIFNDNSEIGQQLTYHQEYKFKHKYSEDENTTLQRNNKNLTVIKFSIPQRITNLEKQLKDNKKINAGSFFINTPIIKSGMILSQLTLYDTNATNVLSTQTNYNPLLLSMTQYQDRKNMIIANSITQNKDVLIETNSLLDNDIMYDWINYTTSVGIDYFSHLINGEKREYDIEIQENQMIYPIELLQPSFSRFIPYKSVYEEQ
ncbi:MAG: hypothetical protein C0628_04535 [Sulfurimonas sp.]|uniref:hypothetical protein n=1 Tax=uncultured Arcobacter sp. TaxID=165434 RepID=UPI000CB9DCFA|nr:hypothetical protein [uncultured Arcobacter sp.]PLY14224.1 MAG: hypothetical protein C0628_04535 [Sulfurimonas sp.]